MSCCSSAFQRSQDCPNRLSEWRMAIDRVRLVKKELRRWWSEPFVALWRASLGDFGPVCCGIVRASSRSFHQVVSHCCTPICWSDMVQFVTECVQICNCNFRASWGTWRSYISGYPVPIYMRLSLFDLVINYLSADTTHSILTRNDVRPFLSWAGSNMISNISRPPFCGEIFRYVKGRFATGQIRYSFAICINTL